MSTMHVSLLGGCHTYNLVAHYPLTRAQTPFTMISRRQIWSSTKTSAVRSSQRNLSVSVSATDVAQSSSAADSGEAPEAAAKERRITATIKKPLGMVLAEASNGAVFIESIEEGGNAAQQGDVKVGDIVRKTSARMLKEGKSGDYAKKGHGARPYDDWEAVMFPCDGEDFQTVLAAVRSNNERWGIKEVTLEVSRPQASI